jgi:hypothetical protein
MPVVAQEISGKIFTLDANDVFNGYVKLSFLESGEAELEFPVKGELEPRISLVGQDGLYRPSLSGKPVLARGEWVDNQTFKIEYNEGPGLNMLFFMLKYDGDQLKLDITGVGSFTGTMQE